MHRKTQDPLLRILHHDKLCKLKNRKFARLIRAPPRPQAQRAHGANIDNRLRAAPAFRPQK